MPKDSQRTSTVLTSPTESAELTLRALQDQKEKGRAEGRAKGRAEGINLGDAKTKRKIAAKMKSMGLSPEQIAQATDLSIEVINSL